MNDEASGSSEIIEREANDKRAELHATLSELRGRFSAGTITEGILESIGGSGGRRLVAAASANPLAAILAVAGIGWLFFTAQRQEREARASPSLRGLMTGDQGELKVEGYPDQSRLERWDNEGGAA